MRPTEHDALNLDEQAAIAALQAGDLAGLDALVQLHQLRAVRTAYLIAGDRAAAEDIVADAFVTAYQHIGGFDTRRPFAPWFMRIVVNGALMKLRRERRSTSLNEVDDWPDSAPSPEDRAGQREQRNVVRAAIQALSPEQRTVVVLRFYLDLSEREVAQVMQTPIGTVKWRLHAAKRALRRTLSASSVQDQLTGQWEA